MEWMRRARLLCGISAAVVFCLWVFFALRGELERRSSAAVARRLIGAGEYDRAGEPLARWLAQAPDCAEARFLAARRAVALERFDEAFAQLEAARKLGHSPDQIDRERGIALARIGRLSEAEPILRKLFMASAGEKSADPDLDEALTKCYVENFQLRAAEEVVKRWIVDAPRAAKAQYWHAELLRRKSGSDARSLINEFEQVLQLDDHFDQARITLGQLYLSAHRNSDAEREFTMYLQRHPEDVEARLGLGQIAAEDGRETVAIQILDRSIKLAPDDWRPLFLRGKIESRAGRFARALDFFDKAASLDLVEPEIQYQRSVMLGSLGRVNEAKKARAEMARLRRENDELDKLINDLRKSPEEIELQYRAAQWFFVHGRPAEGLRWTEKILRQNSRHAETNRLLADHYQRTGQHGLAQFYKLQGGDR